MFNKSKYTKLYYKIINRARIRIIEGYFENHHIVPKSLGGSDDDENIVKLSPREHYVCHWLLTKMTTGSCKSKMLFALWSMSNQKGEFRPDRNYRISSSRYEQIRNKVSDLLIQENSGRKYPNRKSPVYSEELKNKKREIIIALNKSKKGKKLSEETKAKIRAKRSLQDMSYLKGKKRSEETKAKIRAKRALQTNVRNQYSESQPKSP